MRIGVDATGWLNNRGYGRHARGVLSALVRRDDGNRYVFVIDAQSGIWQLPARAEVRLIRSSTPTVLAASSDGHRSLADMWHMSRALSARDFDLLLFPSVYSYVPVVSRAKKVVMIHDVIAETFPELTVPNLTARWFWNAKVALGRYQADALVTVSEYSRQGMVKHFHTAAEKIFVVGEASDPLFQVIQDPQASAALSFLDTKAHGRSVIYLGGFGPHKNIDRLIGAFAAVAARREYADVKLILVGEYQKEVFHSSFQALKRRIDELKVTERVVFTGYLADKDLVLLLNLATVLVLPSLMEGFGLPAIEAAACGCPVIATQESPLPGLLQDGALYIDPTEQSELEVALDRVLNSAPLRQQMRTAGIAAAKRLTWDAAADQLRGVFQNLADR